MRNIVFVIALLSLGITGCVKDETPVRETAQAYLTARLNSDFVTSAQYVDEASVDRLEDLELLVLTEVTEDFVGEFTIDEVVFVKQKALVVYTLRGYGQDTLEMVSHGEEWKVDLSSNSAVPDAGVLWQELRELEFADTTQKELKALDRVLFEEDSIGEAFDVPRFEEDLTPLDIDEDRMMEMDSI